MLVDRRWLAAYAQAFERWPTAAFFGGPIEPWFEGTPPRWLAEHWRKVAHAYAVRELGDVPFPFNDSQLPYGRTVPSGRMCSAGTDTIPRSAVAHASA